MSRIRQPRDIELWKERFLVEKGVRSIQSYSPPGNYIARVDRDGIRYARVEMLGDRNHEDWRSVSVKIHRDQSREECDDGYWGFLRYDPGWFVGIYRGLHQCISSYKDHEGLELDGIGLFVHVTVQHME